MRKSSSQNLQDRNNKQLCLNRHTEDQTAYVILCQNKKIPRHLCQNKYTSKALTVLILSLSKKLCSVDIVYRRWGKQGSLVKECTVHLINNADKFLKYAEYSPVLSV